MSWLYTPIEGTLSSGGVPWTTGFTLTLTDWQNIERDIHTWGGNVNAGGNLLTNLVGISTATGTLALNAASTNAVIQLQVGVSGSGSDIQFWKDSTPSDAVAIGCSLPGASSSSDMVFSTYAGSWAEKIRLTNGGSLGIGSSSPISALDVRGANGSPVSSGSGANGVLAVGPAGSTNTLYFGTAAGVSGNPVWIQSSDRTNLATNYPIAINPNGGNVCIGGLSPISPALLTLHLATNQNLNVEMASSVLSIVAVNDAGSANVPLAMYASSYALIGLPSSNPGAGTKQLWYDPSDSNRVKYAS